MPNALTAAQLQGYLSQLAETSPGSSNFESVVNGVYSQLSQQGYGYANLAAGLVTCSTLSGNVAQNFMANYASSQGVALSSSQIQKIELDMANAYVNTLLQMASAPNGDGTVSTDITYQQAAQFHSAVFTSDGLSANAWTLYAPGQVLDSQSMQALWVQIISPDPATSNLGSAELYSAMSFIGGVGTPDAPANLSDDSITAANWTNNVTVAGLTSVFSGSNACSIGSITVDDQYGEGITTQVGDDSGTNGSYAISSMGSSDYLQGTDASLTLSNASLTLGSDTGTALTVSNVSGSINVDNSGNVTVQDTGSTDGVSTTISLNSTDGSGSLAVGGQSVLNFGAGSSINVDAGSITVSSAPATGWTESAQLSQSGALTQTFDSTTSGGSIALTFSDDPGSISGAAPQLTSATLDGQAIDLSGIYSDIQSNAQTSAQDAATQTGLLLTNDQSAIQTALATGDLSSLPGDPEGWLTGLSSLLQSASTDASVSGSIISDINSNSGDVALVPPAGQDADPPPGYDYDPGLLTVPGDWKISSTSTYLKRGKDYTVL